MNPDGSVRPDAEEPQKDVYRYASVIIDISHEKVDRPFQYRIPDALLGKITVGTCVQIPFGKGNRERSGYVVELTDSPVYAPDRIKEIMDISPRGASARSRQILLAAWIRERYGSTMITALKTVLPARRKTKAQEKRRIVLAVTKDVMAASVEECRRKHQSARLRLLECLQADGEISYEYATKTLAVSSSVIRAVEQMGIVTVVSETLYRNPVNRYGTAGTPVILSSEQQAVVEAVLADYGQGKTGTYLVHGITGSGKTEVYMELIAGIIALGRQAIMLIPEIALTYQTVSRFTARFGARVSVLHSRLSAGERYDQCERAARGEIDVMIGPRSALFTPFERLGLIIMDEEHENSYKSESMPKYHAREAAEKLASLCGASLVLGSATPSLEAYYASEQGRIRRFTLTKRLTGGRLPQVYVEDLRKELRQGNRSVFSARLQNLLEQRLQAGEQSILFLNRRGYAGFVSCRACGHVMKCPHCDVSLSEHGGGRLSCHYCGYEQPAVSRCPICGSGYIMGFRAGTEQIEATLHRLWPQARVLRMDADTTRKKGSFEEILAAFAQGKADILVGTQMIVKGHDFPNVTLVGILAADLSLHAGDYRAGERTFQLLTQAAGRAGRGKRPGEVVIQTYQPEHHSIVYAARQDYEGFYEEEMAYRSLLGYPPAGHMLAALVLSAEEERGAALARWLVKKAGRLALEIQGPQVQKALPGIQIIGPSQAAIAKIGDQYRMIFYIKSNDGNVLIRIRDALERRLGEIHCRTETVQFDFDPMISY